LRLLANPWMYFYLGGLTVKCFRSPPFALGLWVDVVYCARVTLQVNIVKEIVLAAALM